MELETIDTAEEKKFWPDKLMAMNIGQIENLPWNKRRTIRGAISDRIKNDFPEYGFTTQKVNIGGVTYLEVERIR